MMKFLKIITTTILLLSVFENDSKAQDRTWWEWLFGIDNQARDLYDAEMRGLEKRIDLNKWWSFNIGDNKDWSLANFDDSNWEKIMVPSTWENEGFHGYDGIAWYRISFDGRFLSKNEIYYAVLGFIDDVDMAFLNGEIIGNSGRFPPKFKTAYTSNRKYRIPQNLINYNGSNVLAIRVYDHVLNGGIVDGDLGIYAHNSPSFMEQELFGRWKFRKRDREDYKFADYNDNNWDDILVPSFWDNQGHRSFDGVAWYRKTFHLNFAPSQYNTYYLVLGKIDDFDETYINGVMIGSTNDGERFGRSHSYEMLRIYEIPNGVLRPGEKNTVAVRVHDIGYNGGIYTGSVGIVEKRNLHYVRYPQD